MTSSNCRRSTALALACVFAATASFVTVQWSPTVAEASSPTFTNRTAANSELGSDTVRGVFVSGSTVYAATNGGGLSISTPSTPTPTTPVPPVAPVAPAYTG
ncbi:MAG: hypothetical protein FJW83_00760 [Actinobacteria bacterium]|nr:hypothetical protein [Actinomycetota bacterium]